MGRAPGWHWVPELQVRHLALRRPLVAARAASPVELRLVTATAVQGQPSPATLRTVYCVLVVP
eukprot:6601142-Alexandrium_andersonii.AAC.1